MRRASYSGPFSGLAAQWAGGLPEEAKNKIRTERAVARIHEQFSQLVSPFVLSHVNAVYLTSDDVASPSALEDAASKGAMVRKLVVYVDDSTVAAELNARRELIRLKYLERFAISLTSFDIKISKGKYRERHPYAESQQARKPVSRETELPADVRSFIDEAVSGIEDESLRRSFERAMAANARKSEKE